VNVSKTIEAPLRFVFTWATDFRETDPKITGSSIKRNILLRTNHRVVYADSYRSHGKPLTGVSVVTLYPPNSWHLDYIGDEDDETGDYLLMPLGRGRTRIDMTFTEHYRINNAPSRQEYARNDSEFWDKLVVALEKEYKKVSK
jgi:hypothetical protein